MIIMLVAITVAVAFTKRLIGYLMSGALVLAWKGPRPCCDQGMPASALPLPVYQGRKSVGSSLSWPSFSGIHGGNLVQQLAPVLAGYAKVIARSANSEIRFGSGGPSLLPKLPRSLSDPALERSAEGALLGESCEKGNFRDGAIACG